MPESARVRYIPISPPSVSACSWVRKIFSSLPSLTLCWVQKRCHGRREDHFVKASNVHEAAVCCGLARSRNRTHATWRPSPALKRYRALLVTTSTEGQQSPASVPRICTHVSKFVPSIFPDLTWTPGQTHHTERTGCGSGKHTTRWSQVQKIHFATQRAALCRARTCLGAVGLVCRSSLIARALRPAIAPLASSMVRIICSRLSWNLSLHKKGTVKRA